jgi:hypothetical protein
MTHRHKLTRGQRSLGKAETAEADTEADTAETETARYPRAQKIQQFNQKQARVTLHDADSVPLPEPAHLDIVCPLRGKVSQAFRSTSRDIDTYNILCMHFL